MRKTAAFLIAAVAVLACRADELVAPGIVLTGVVEDATGAIVPGAKLTLTETGTRAELKAKPDETGRFRFESLTKGEYILKAKADNFETFEIPVRITGGSPEPVRVRMKVSTKGEQVTVKPESGPDVEIALDPGDNANAVKIEEELLFNLPMQGQNVLGALSPFMSPAAQGAMGPSIVVDGVEGAFNVPAWSIKRIRMNKSPYSAQFSRPGKSRIEVTTRDGRSNFHGGVTMFARDSALDARNPFAATKPDMSRRLYEARVTGPVSGIPLWYFVSAERLSDRQSAFVNALVPEGPVVENVETPLYRTNFLGRLDIKPSNMHSMDIRYSFVETTNHNDGVGGFDLRERGYSARERQHTFRFGDRRIWTSNVSNDFRIQFERTEDSEGSPAGSPASIVRGAFKGGPATEYRSEHETSVKLQNGINYYVGKHRLQFGGQIRPRFFDVRQQTNFGGVFEFASLDLYSASRPFVFRVNQGDPNLSFSQPVAFDYVQDQVQLRPDLHILAGLRHEWQGNLGDGHRLAPRLAIAYSPGQRKTVIRAGAGMFYEDLPKSVTRQRLLFNGVRLRELVIADPPYPDPFSGVTPDVAPPSVVRVSTDLTLPYVMQGSIAVEQGLGQRVQLTVEYQTLRGVHLYRSRNINAPMSDTQLRPDPSFQNINQVESSGTMRSNSLEVGLRWNVKRLSGMAQYTLLRTSDDAYGLFALPANNYDLTAEWGPADYDRRHQFSFLSGADLPGKWRIGSILTLGSALPYNITTGRDINGDTEATDRPFRVTRNTGRGGDLVQVDVRLTKTFDVFRLYKKAKRDTNNLELSLDVFNVLNRTNFDRFVGVFNSQFFGSANAALPARTLQTSLRYSW